MGTSRRPVFCILEGPTRGRAWPLTAVRGELCELAVQAGVRRRLPVHLASERDGVVDIRLVPR